MEEIRIMLIDDHPIYRKGIALTLMDADNSINIVSEAENVKEAIDALCGNTHNVQLVLLDLQLPDGNGIEMAQFVKEHFADMKILVLSAEDASGRAHAPRRVGRRWFSQQGLRHGRSVECHTRRDGRLALLRQEYQCPHRPHCAGFVVEP